MSWPLPNHEPYCQSKLCNLLFERLKINTFFYSRYQQITNKSQVFYKILLNASDYVCQHCLLLLGDLEVSWEKPGEGTLSALAALTWKYFFLSHLASKRRLSGDKTKGMSEQSYLSEYGLREKTIHIEKNKIIEVCRKKPGQIFCMLTGRKNSMGSVGKCKCVFHSHNRKCDARFVCLLVFKCILWQLSGYHLYLFFPALDTQNDGATAQEDKRNEGFLIATNKAEGTWGRHFESSRIAWSSRAGLEVIHKQCFLFLARKLCPLFTLYYVLSQLGAVCSARTDNSHWKKGIFHKCKG